MTDVAVGDLRAGDVLLYHGSAFLSRLIRLFDGGPYSHASIYDGGQIVEAIDSGITPRDVRTSIAGASYVDVYRFRDSAGAMLGNPLNDQPVRRTVAGYLKRRDRYAYEQLLLLALLASTRRLPEINAALAMILRNLLDAAADVLARMMAGGRQPMICSEFVYRCYVESGDAYFINVRGADIAAAAAAVAASAGAAAVVAAASAPLAASATTAAVAAYELEAAEFLAQYAAARAPTSTSSAAAAPSPPRGRRGRRGRKREGTAAAATADVFAAAVPDFVTPRDLQRSPNLIKIGTLRA